MGISWSGSGTGSFLMIGSSCVGVGGLGCGGLVVVGGGVVGVVVWLKSVVLGGELVGVLIGVIRGLAIVSLSILLAGWAMISGAGLLTVVVPGHL